MLALWSCGRRRSVVQAQRQIHRAFAGSYAATYALRHTRHADPTYPLAPPRKIGREEIRRGNRSASGSIPGEAMRLSYPDLPRYQIFYFGITPEFGCRSAQLLVVGADI